MKRIQSDGFGRNIDTLINNTPYFVASMEISKCEKQTHLKGPTMGTTESIVLFTLIANDTLSNKEVYNMSSLF